jgi:predicted dinucleotide-binding enzyme
MKIGIIGSGMIGSTVGELWVKAGHEVMFSSRHPERLQSLIERLGKKASRGTPKEAAAFGEVLLMAVPYKALPELGRELAAEIKGKVVLEAGNPYPNRDGEVAIQVQASGKGSGLHSAEHLAGARVVRAFNTIFYKVLASDAHRPGERLGIPLAGDDAEAMEKAAALVRDAGFDPVPIGPLTRARDFDPGTPVYGKALTARELGAALGPAASA